MRFWLKFAAAALTVCAECDAYGHGNAVLVSLNGQNKLVVTGGLATPSGWTMQAFDDHEDSLFSLGPGSTQIAQTPGFRANDVTPGSGLFLEVVPRPDFTLPLRPLRWMWHWSKSSQQVATAPNNPSLELASVDGFGSVILTQFTAPVTGPSVKIMEPTSEQLGVHEHPLIYLLDDSPAAPLGAYGFFARLTSPNYSASDPFLIAINHSLSVAEYKKAARAINAAARLPGDYDNDEDADGADFLLWQRTLGSTTALAADGSLNDVVDDDDLAIWEDHFGETYPSGVATQILPEPRAALIALEVVLSSLWLGRRRQKKSVSDRPQDER
jgi:hypothetical protein